MADAGAIRAGKAQVEVGVKDLVSGGLKAIGGKIRAFGASLGSIGSKLAAAGTQITAPMLAAAKSFASTAFELKAVSDRTGVSVEALSQLGYAAQQTGADMASVEVGIKKMQKAIVAAAMGTAEAQQAFLMLGINFYELTRLSPEKQFAAIAKRIAAIEDPTLQAATALQIFGKSGTQLLPLINDFDRLTHDARKLGFVMSREDAENGAKLQQALNILNTTVRKLSSAVGSALAPMLIDVANWLSRNVAIARDWIKEHKPMIQLVFKIGAGLLSMSAGFIALGAALSGPNAALKAVSVSLGLIAPLLGALFNPIALVITGLTVLAGWFVTSTKTGGAALAWLGDRFGDLKDDALGAFKGISDALVAGDIKLAAEVFWAFLKLEWARGIAFLNQQWADWGVSVRQTFADVSYWIAGKWVETWAGMQSAVTEASAGINAAWIQGNGVLVDSWLVTTNILEETWDGFMTFLQASWNSTSGFLAAGFAALQSFWKPVIDLLVIDFKIAKFIIVEGWSLIAEGAQIAFDIIKVAWSGVTAVMAAEWRIFYGIFGVIIEAIGKVAGVVFSGISWWIHEWIGALEIVAGWFGRIIKAAADFLGITKAIGEFNAVQEQTAGKNAGVQADAAKQAADRRNALEQQLRAAEEERKQRLAGVEAGRQAERAAIQGNKQDQLAALRDQQQAEAEARKKAARDAIAAAQYELDAASEDLRNFLEKAAKQARAARKKPGELEQPEFPDLGGLGPTLNKFSSHGTFNAAAVRGLGISDSLTDIASKQLAEQKQIRQGIDQGNRRQMVFGA